jgi:hypothetical protein
MIHIANAVNDGQSQDQENSGLLILPSKGGATPKTVYAKQVIINGQQKAGFALQSTATTWHTGGISWEFAPEDAEYALFINFVLVSGISKLALNTNPTTPTNPTFWFSEGPTPVDAQTGNQWSCAPIVVGKTTTYHFNAKLEGGTMFDPKIVITPLP